MLDGLATLGAQAQPWMAVITALVITAPALFILRRRHRRRKTQQAQAATGRPAGLEAKMELEHGAALRENMERMRKEAPFRRRNG